MKEIRKEELQQAITLHNLTTTTQKLCQYCVEQFLEKTNTEEENSY